VKTGALIESTFFNKLQNCGEERWGKKERREGFSKGENRDKGGKKGKGCTFGSAFRKNRARPTAVRKVIVQSKREWVNFRPSTEKGGGWGKGWGIQKVS